MPAGLQVDVDGDGAIDVSIHRLLPFAQIIERHNLPDSANPSNSYYTTIKTKAKKPFVYWYSLAETKFYGDVDYTIGDIDSEGYREISIQIDRKKRLDFSRGKAKWSYFDYISPKGRGGAVYHPLVKDFVFVVGDING